MTNCLERLLKALLLFVLQTKIFYFGICGYIARVLLDLSLSVLPTLMFAAFEVVLHAYAIEHIFFRGALNETR